MPIFQYVEAMDKEHLCRNFFRDAAGFTKGWEDSLEETATDGIYDPAAAGDKEKMFLAYRQQNAISFTELRHKKLTRKLYVQGYMSAGS